MYCIDICLVLLIFGIISACLVLHHPGFAGGAIYFSRSPDGACRKYKNGRGNPEILIECDVQLGRCLEAGKHVIGSREEVQRKGFDSVKIDGLDVSLLAI